MSLADRQFIRPERRKGDALVFLERAVERHESLEAFTKREVTPSRIQRMLGDIGRCARANQWDFFCKIANTLFLLAADRLPKELLSRETFDHIVERSLSETPPYTLASVGRIRTLETLFADSYSCPPELERRIQEMIGDMFRLSPLLSGDETSWKSFYSNALNLAFLDPAHSSLLTRETAERLAEDMQKVRQSQSVEGRAMLMHPASSVAILQPELKSILPIDAQLMSDISDFLAEAEVKSPFLMTGVLQDTAIFLADEAVIPSRGRLVLRSQTILPARQPLPLRPEY